MIVEPRSLRKAFAVFSLSFAILHTKNPDIEDPGSLFLMNFLVLITQSDQAEESKDVSWFCRCFPIQAREIEPGRL